MSENPELSRVAHARALMLGSSAFPPAEHLRYLEAHGPRVGAGMGRIAVTDLLVRDVAMPLEQSEVIRVISETLIRFSVPHRHLLPPAANATPARLLAADMVWFGFERAGRLVGVHGGFFWNPTLWVRRFHALLDSDGGSWDTHFQLDTVLYGHLWAQGMRETMILVPTAPEFLAERRAAGWTDSHEAAFAGNARPLLWMRQTFAFQPGLPALLTPDPIWQAET